MFPTKGYEPQTVVGYNLQPDILIHGSPCQSFSISGHQGKASGSERINRGQGGDEGSGSTSSLMWETVHIIENMGNWKPKVVIWENVKNVLSKYMKHNFDRYLNYMEHLGYTNSYRLLDARNFGVPQFRERVFTVSVLENFAFNFNNIKYKEMKTLDSYLENNVSDIYKVTQPSVYKNIGEKGIRRATIIQDYCFTITTRQDRTPAQIIDLGNGNYRYLTELECWRLMGYNDEDYFAASLANPAKNGKMNRTLYHQAGNSIVVPVLEGIFDEMINQNLIKI